jgi:hypothetical protein
MKIPILAILAIPAACAAPGTSITPDAPTPSPDGRADAGRALGPVLVIGDSISLGYTPLVTAVMPSVTHIPSYSTTTAYALPDLTAWLGATPSSWVTIHFNFGLHDIDLLGSGSAQVPTVSPADYAANLQTIVATFRAKAPQAALIWGTTTPVPKGSACPPADRTNADVLEYNDLAAAVMTEETPNVYIDDLYSVAASDPSVYMMPCDVHMTPAGYAALATSVEAAITANQ